MSEKAETRIEAELKGTPDPDGEEREGVQIPASGLDLDEVDEVDYVEDVIDEEDDEYRVYARVESRNKGQVSKGGRRQSR